MSFVVRSLLRLSPDLDGFRRSGWRATCEFANVVAPDGAKRFGCEVSLLGIEHAGAGDQVGAELRFWSVADNRTGVDAWHQAANNGGTR